MNHVVTGLSDLNIAGVIQLAKNVHTALTGNPNVPSPTPTLAALQALITAAETKNDAFEAQKDVLHSKMNERDAAVRDLINGLRTEAVTVQWATGGDPAKIETTGFRARVRPARIGIPGQVTDLKLTAGDDDGILKAAWKAMRGIDTYEMETTTDPGPTGVWASKGTVKKTRAVLNSFTSGQRIWLRVRAVGTAGFGAWSDPAAKIVP